MTRNHKDGNSSKFIKLSYHSKKKTPKPSQGVRLVDTELRGK